MTLYRQILLLCISLFTQTILSAQSVEMSYYKLYNDVYLTQAMAASGSGSQIGLYTTYYAYKPSKKIDINAGVYYNTFSTGLRRERNVLFHDELNTDVKISQKQRLLGLGLRVSPNLKDSALFRPMLTGQFGYSETRLNVLDATNENGEQSKKTQYNLNKAYSPTYGVQLDLMFNIKYFGGLLLGPSIIYTGYTDLSMYGLSDITIGNTDRRIKLADPYNMKYVHTWYFGINLKSNFSGMFKSNKTPVATPHDEIYVSK